MVPKCRKCLCNAEARGTFWHQHLDFEISQSETWPFANVALSYSNPMVWPFVQILMNSNNIRATKFKAWNIFLFSADIFNIKLQSSGFPPNYFSVYTYIFLPSTANLMHSFNHFISKIIINMHNTGFSLTPDLYRKTPPYIPLWPLKLKVGCSLCDIEVVIMTPKF